MYKLRAKFFYVMLAVNVLLAGVLYFFLRYNFESSFSSYVGHRQEELAESLATELEVYFAGHGNWREFRENPDQLMSLLRLRGRRMVTVVRTGGGPSGSEPAADMDVIFGHGEPPFPPPQVKKEPPFNGSSLNPGSPPRTPFFLLDKDRSLIAGGTWPLDDSYLRPLRADNAVIGYLGMPNNPEIRELVDIRFASNQSKNLAVIVIAALLFALLAAIPLSQLMAKRITTLVDHVRKLSMGSYDDPPPRFAGNDELNVLAEHLTDLGRTLSKSEQQRNRWVADISHELRTPVAILQADLEAIEDGVRDLDQRAVTRLQDHVLRLRNLINDLHDLSLSDIGSLTYRKSTCDMAALIGEAVDLMRPQLEQRGLSLGFTMAGDKSISVLGDGERLTQLFLNLLQNSLNYTETPGQVNVAVNQHDDHVVAQIDDSAPGVDKTLQRRLTERLFRAECSRSRRTGGAGLGLAICANIVAAHGGELLFDDSDLGGLRVIVKLPVAKG